ncbi:GGDEF domain-containing protein [Limoniibacter endophyticus]|uniref:Diguanylate cyclase DosC n=1 Tax=Limoniibacter endophyticus TaxID=1565040 RepID=A0A8J3DS15_9HYPH|nr:GGDEF domain-containing protein [Limoniibacter endophyticus]GHC71159.1 diguanylate cyclase [Limoniibacter endophyticus]
MTEKPGLSIWESTPEASLVQSRGILTQIVHEHVDALVGKFYSVFLTHSEGSTFLSHSVVNDRLHSSLRRWLLDLVQTDPDGDLSGFDARQIKIGEVHARLKIPNHLVMEGMTLLKSEISRRVAQNNPDAVQVATTLILLGELVDYSMRLMTRSYVTDTTRRVQTDEAFRLFSLGQDINLERETQRAALMEWSQSVLFGLLGRGNKTLPVSLSASPFGLWVRHRAALLFQGSPILRSIEKLMIEVDEDLLPSIDSETPSSIVALQERMDEVKFHLNDLFQAAANVENGTDPLTRALNRRFLPSVLSREITLAKEGPSELSVLMVDIDHFKSINDTHGHSVGDIALSHTAATLLDFVRVSDFVFRYGGEEFLIVLVETGRTEALTIAERIRQRLAALDIPLSEHENLKITASIGVATFEGHPDYEYLINAADRALYEAKRSGRNRVIEACAA